MEFDQPFKILEQRDTSNLRDQVLAVADKVWLENQVRQQVFDVHYQTQSLVMLFIEASNWPNAHISREAGWSVLAPLALPLMHDIINKHYSPGGVVLRAMAAKLVAGGIIKPHVDAHPSFRLAHRIHIPLTSSPRVRFMIEGKPYQFEVGNIYELNNQRQHSVMNKGNEDRITFIFDYLPPQQLAEVHLTGQCKLPDLTELSDNKIQPS